MKWSASQNVTARISDFKEKREDLYNPYNEEMVDKALLAVASALGTDVSRSNLVYNKEWFFKMQWFNPIYYKSYCRVTRKNVGKFIFRRNVKIPENEPRKRKNPGKFFCK